MPSNIGFHIFKITKHLLMKNDADKLFEDFKKYAKVTKAIDIISEKYDADPNGRHFKFVYSHQYKGITWKLRFCDSNFFGEEYNACSISAIINPKMLVGE